MSAAYHVQPPEPFTFTRPEEWPKWARRFERFRSASGLSEKDETVQVNTLLYSMGDEADDILRSFTLSADDMKKYDIVKDKFDHYFVKKIFERAKFNMRKQEEGESVDSFVTALYALAEHCSYGALHDEMIRDRLVVGLQSAKMSEKLQLDSELTLEKAVTQAEAIKQQQTLLRGEPGVQSHLPVGSINKGKPSQTPFNLEQSPRNAGPHNNTSCTRCGLSPKHEMSRCPARDAECHRCKRWGHFMRVCRSQPRFQPRFQPQSGVGAIQEGSVDSFLGVVSGPWVVTVSVNGHPVEFQIDSGAEVTAIPSCVFQQLQAPPLHPAERTLKGPTQSILPVRGRFKAIL